MKKLFVIFSAVILTLGLVALGALLKSEIVVFKDSARIVYVRGLSERIVRADNVRWPLQYKIIGNDLTALYSEMQKNYQQIFSFLKSNGIPDSDITVALPAVVDLYTDRYVNVNYVRSRYNITSTVTETITNIN